ncbi:MAG: 2-hydroxychromene-2-carboxylate isomerase [Alphaproteobacteria bacterium]|nr:2-hydroxychromene-2-carboxylate isomerase [Alphaproteobacteria bacterium]
MSKVIDYYFSLISPFAYLGGQELASIAARHQASVNVYPIQLAKIFPASGGLPLPKRAKQRRDYRLLELARWRDFRGIPLNMSPKFFPAAEESAARLVIAARDNGQDTLALSNAILRAVWAEDRDIAENDTLATIAKETGLDDQSLLGAAGHPAIPGIYDADTDNAIEAGVFGSPTYIVDGELFWGQDRLGFVERKLEG